MASDLTLAATQQIERAIHVIRGQNVMLDSDLAALYGVQTRVLLQSVRRHLDRFPDDFMFQLTKDEYQGLRSQIVTSNGRGGRRYRPFAFTEQGVAMLSRILNSPRAIQVNIEIMRTFVRLRRLLETNAELARRLDELEQKYDAQFGIIFDAIRQLMAPPDPPRRRLGFPIGTQDESP
jgi:ORF6N domain